MVNLFLGGIVLYREKQYRKLYMLLKYLSENNVYYSTLLKKYSIDLCENNIEEIYLKLPVVGRNMIIDNYKEYLSKSIIEDFGNVDEIINKLKSTDGLSENHDREFLSKTGKKYFAETTSGTTGKPFTIVKSQKERLIEASYLYSCRKKIYNKVNVNNGFLFVHKVDPVLKMYDYREKNNRIEMFDKVYYHLIKTKPKWIFATTFILNNFVQYLIKTNRINELNDLNLKFIETTSQKVLKEDRDLIEKIFNTKVINNYGCREVWNIAYEDQAGDLTLNDENLIIDVVDDNGNIIIEENKIGEVVITSLVNRTMPLIKYYLGDRASIKKIGKKRVIKLEDGRKIEMIEGTNYSGTTIFRKVLRTLNFHNKIEDIKNIRIIQKAIEKFEVFIEKGKINDEYFEREFIKVFTDQMSSRQNYKFIFNYYYPFKKNSSVYKEVIFRNEV